MSLKKEEGLAVELGHAHAAPARQHVLRGQDYGEVLHHEPSRAHHGQRQGAQADSQVEVAVDNPGLHLVLGEHLGGEDQPGEPLGHEGGQAPQRCRSDSPHPQSTGATGDVGQRLAHHPLGPEDLAGVLPGDATGVVEDKTASRAIEERLTELALQAPDRAR